MYVYLLALFIAMIFPGVFGADYLENLGIAYIFFLISILILILWVIRDNRRNV